MKLNLLNVVLSSPLLLCANALEKKRMTGSRIYNGNTVLADTYPWFTSLIVPYNEISEGVTYVGEATICGAVLVAPDMFLTAAHCFEDGDIRFANVGALSAPFLPGSNGGQRIEKHELDAVFIHPDYDPINIDNDFALGRLSTTSSIEPAIIDGYDELSEGFSGKENYDYLFILEFSIALTCCNIF